MREVSGSLRERCSWLEGLCCEAVGNNRGAEIVSKGMKKGHMEVLLLRWLL